jgi:TolB-like protein
MKKSLVFVVFMVLASLAFAQTLDNVIGEAAMLASNRFSQGTTVVVLNFKSDSEKLSGYIIEELNEKLLNIGKLRLVERRNLNEIRAELDFNMSGEVSDESAQSIGRMLGSQYIILGSVDTIGNQNRIRFRAISTETATIEWSFSSNIKNDAVLASLLDKEDRRGTSRPSKEKFAIGAQFGIGNGLGTTYSPFGYYEGGGYLSDGSYHSYYMESVALEGMALFGILADIGLGLKLGNGNIVFDLRYLTDFLPTTFFNGGDSLTRRGMTFSLAYEYWF